MDFPKTTKKAKNGVRQDEQLLIKYSGGEHRSDESDSDRVKPLELPPTRLRRPKTRKIRVSSSSSKNVFTLWNFCQVLFVVVVIGTMVCMVWFTIVLKTSLDSMKLRVSILETSDRSTSKECAERGKDLRKKVEALQGSTSGVVSSDEKHFKLLLHKISVLNRTVNYLKQKLKSPKSVSSIHNDISLLKKAMADTSREMTELADKIAQLRKIAHLENNNVKQLRVQLYNVSVQIAKLSGEPTPRPVVNTATPPWLLRVPADSDSQSKTKKLTSIEADQLKRNITSLVKKDMSKIIAYVKKANKSVHNQVISLQLKLSAVTKSVSKQKVLMDKLVKKANQDNTKNTTLKHKTMAVDYGVMRQVNNLTAMLETLTRQFGEHDTRFEELVNDVSSMNSTLHQHMYKKGHPVVASCNCSLAGVWKAMSKDKDIITSLQSKLNSLKKSVENHNHKVAILQTTTKPQTPLQDEESTVSTTRAPEVVPSETEAMQESTRHKTKKLKTLEPTTVHKTVKIISSSEASQTKPKPTTSTKATTTTPTPLKDDTTKRDQDDYEDSIDLNSDQKGDSDDLPPLETAKDDQ